MAARKSQAISRHTRPGFSIVVMIIVAIIFVGLGYLGVKKAFDSAIDAGDKQNETGGNAAIKGFVNDGVGGMQAAIQKTANDDFLIEAIKEQDVDAIKYLVEEGANVNQRNTAGGTPLHMAAGRGNIEIAQILIDAQANTEAKSKLGSTPLHTAILTSQPSTEMVTLLLDQWVDVDAQDNDGKTPLHLAAEKGLTEITQILIEDYEADVNIKDSKGQTPIKAAKLAITQNKAPTQQINKTIQLIQAKGGK